MSLLVSIASQRQHVVCISTKQHTKIPRARPLGICGVGTFHFVACFAVVFGARFKLPRVGELNGRSRTFFSSEDGREGHQGSGGSFLVPANFPCDLQLLLCLHGIFVVWGGTAGMAGRVMYALPLPVLSTVDAGQALGNAGSTLWFLIMFHEERSRGISSTMAFLRLSLFSPSKPAKRAKT
ncbi:hypothetical protein BDP55DRAFT_656082 [Colletotrichum godetiae]|uniref:Transmembrane protein n=1 Tax=Colletotrichum godetiae TaxID=1209918 RepID=A0AAJ0AT57_9PEZI|nr:uncharacterized protein BDP55DRAFT_656082 [Colletotrichum godetiae]KAK1688486.1 hypothetical protein BDP55DRAFT_656082 [Colletotrichum godetiae]